MTLNNDPPTSQPSRYFLLFAGRSWYPQGGFFDFRGQYDNFETVKRIADEHLASLDENYDDIWDWANIAQFDDGQVSIIYGWRWKTKVWIGFPPEVIGEVETGYV